MEGGNREELVWEGGVGVSSKRSISSSTSLLIPEDGQLGSTGMGRGRESPSAFVNSFQGQKTSQAQTLNYPLQAPLAAAAAIHSPLRSARTDCRTAWRRWKGVPHPPPPPRHLWGTSVTDGETSRVGAGARLENSLIKCHQGGGGGRGHVSENSGHKQTQTHLPMLTAGQF